MEQEKKEKEEVYFLRTLLRTEVHERLKDFAQRYTTGRGDWDFGVAVQILLDKHDESKLQLQTEKLDYIVTALQDMELRSEDKESEQPDEDNTIELLGGVKINKK